jgi:DNA-binding MarR family transcriptional regulator
MKLGYVGAMGRDGTDTPHSDMRDLMVAVVRAGRVLDEELGARLTAGAGLSLAQFEALTALAAAEEGRLRMTDVSNTLRVGKAAVTRLVDGLAAQGLVERVPCPTDRRAIWAQITPAGRELLARAAPLTETAARELAGTRVGAGDAALARDVVARLAALT